jgi:hypothetical protein
MIGPPSLFLLIERKKNYKISLYAFNSKKDKVVKYSIKVEIRDISPGSTSPSFTHSTAVLKA